MWNGSVIMNNVLNLNFTNYQQHPTNEQYVVFHFSGEARGGYFEELLEKNGIAYEKDVIKERSLWLYAVHRRHLTRVEKLNWQVFARYRKPFIPQKGLRVLVIALFLLLVGLALIGYLIGG